MFSKWGPGLYFSPWTQCLWLQKVQSLAATPAREVHKQSRPNHVERSRPGPHHTVFLLHNLHVEIFGFSLIGRKSKQIASLFLAKLEIKGRSRVNVIYRMKDNTELGPILKSSIEKLKPHVSLVAPQILSHAGKTQHCCQSLDLLHSAYLEGENPNLCVIQKYTSDFDKSQRPIQIAIICSAARWLERNGFIPNQTCVR